MNSVANTFRAQQHLCELLNFRQKSCAQLSSHLFFPCCFNLLTPTESLVSFSPAETEVDSIVLGVQSNLSGSTIKLFNISILTLSGRIHQFQHRSFQQDSRDGNNLHVTLDSALSLTTVCKKTTWSPNHTSLN